jgi:4-aminobutyrate aminotransferase-like enzyme
MATKTAPAASLIDLSAGSNLRTVRNLQCVLLGMNATYQPCEGCELFTSDGRRILDFLSGYSVHNAGHNHPCIIQTLKDELDKRGPGMLQNHVLTVPHFLGDVSFLTRRYESPQMAAL